MTSRLTTAAARRRSRLLPIHPEPRRDRCGQFGIAAGPLGWRPRGRHRGLGIDRASGGRDRDAERKHEVGEFVDVGRVRAGFDRKDEAEVERRESRRRSP
jgi:hypothetical protein